MPGELTTTGMVTLASQLRLLAFLLTNLAAVFAPLSAFGDHAGAGGMRAFLGASHFTPPGTVLSRVGQQRSFRHPEWQTENTMRYRPREQLERSRSYYPPLVPPAEIVSRATSYR